MTGTYDWFACGHVWGVLLRRWFSSIGQGIPRYSYVFTIGIALVCGIFGFVGIVALVMHTTVAMSPPVTMLSAFARYLGILWHMLTGGAVEPADRSIVEQYTSAFVYSLNLLAIVLSSLYLINERRRLLEHAPFFEHHIKSSRDELNAHVLPFMHNIYKNSSNIEVIAGDYDWLLADRKLAEQIHTLQQQRKVKLHSYKSRTGLESVWRERLSEQFYADIFEAITFECPFKLKISFVDYGQGNQSVVFLSESNDKRIAGNEVRRDYSIYEYHSRGNSRTVVEMARGMLASIAQKTS